MDAKTQVAGSAGDSAWAGLWCSEVRSVLGTGLDRALVSYRYPVTVCCDVVGAPRPRASACGESVSRNDWVPETELICFQQVLSEPRVEVE